MAEPAATPPASSTAIQPATPPAESQPATPPTAPQPATPPTAPQPLTPPAVPQPPGPSLGAQVFRSSATIASASGPQYLLILVLAAVIVWLLWHEHGLPAPTPTPIPELAAVDVAAKAYRLDQPRAFRSVAADLRAGTVVSGKDKDALKTAMSSFTKALADAIDAAPDRAAAYDRTASALEAK